MLSSKKQGYRCPLSKGTPVRRAPYVDGRLAVVVTDQWGLRHAVRGSEYQELDVDYQRPCSQSFL
jgi:hypothetical protein